MKEYKNLTQSQKLLADFRSEVSANKKRLGPVTFEIFDILLEEHPEYVTFYIDLFNLSHDELE